MQMVGDGIVEVGGFVVLGFFILLLFPIGEGCKGFPAEDRPVESYDFDTGGELDTHGATHGLQQSLQGHCLYGFYTSQSGSIEGDIDITDRLINYNTGNHSSESEDESEIEYTYSVNCNDAGASNSKTPTPTEDL